MDDYVTVMTPAIDYTMSGLETDAQYLVLSNEGKAVPWLFGSRTQYARC